MYYVYAYLSEDGTPFYIGAGKERRDVSHLRLCRTTYANLPFFYDKLRKMLSAGQRPNIIRLLDGLTRHEAFEIWEPFFIRAIGRRDLRTGPLCNLTDGGDGQCNPSTHWRLAKSREMQRRFASDDERMAQSARTRAHFQSEEARKRVSDQMKILSSTPQWRKARSALMKAVWLDPQRREALVNKAKQRCANPEYRLRLSERAKQRWCDSSYRQRQRLSRMNKPSRNRPL